MAFTLVKVFSKVHYVAINVPFSSPEALSRNYHYNEMHLLQDNYILSFKYIHTIQ